jgi:hypothetical protein
MSARGRLRRVGVFFLFLAGVCGAGLAAVTCTTPPIGWEGAGRLQTLPQPQAEVGAPASDAAVDTGTDTSTTLDSGSDTGSGSDAGSVDAGLGDGAADAADG